MSEPLIYVDRSEIREGRADDRRRTEEAGFDEHLVKPVDPATLASTLTARVER